MYFRTRRASALLRSARNDRSYAGCDVLTFTHDQMARIERSFFYSRIKRFMIERCQRDDFKSWWCGLDRSAALWDPLWARAEHHTEHDLALAMVLLAVAEHSGLLLGEPLRVLQSIGDNEVRVKNFLAARGYFEFTAFDRDERRNSRVDASQ